MWSEQDVNVIRHDHVIAEVVTIGIKVIQGIGNDFTNAWVLQVTLSIARIRPTLNALDEQRLVVFFLCLSVSGSRCACSHASRSDFH